MHWLFAMCMVTALLLIPMTVHMLVKIRPLYTQRLDNTYTKDMDGVGHFEGGSSSTIELISEVAEKPLR